jgi:hypothetical protein
VPAATAEPEFDEEGRMLLTTPLQPAYGRPPTILHPPPTAWIAAQAGDGAAGADEAATRLSAAAHCYRPSTPAPAKPASPALTATLGTKDWRERGIMPP